MAKSVMGLGQFRGRVGGLVFARGDNGSQIIRTYQPVVRNPRSDDQQKQRAKVNFAGRYSKVVPAGLIRSLGNSGRERRGEFMKTLIKAIGVTKSGDEFTAVMNADAVKFSKGINLPMNSSITKMGSDVTITWTDLSGVDGISANAKVLVIWVFANLKPEMEPVIAFSVENMNGRQTSYTVPANLQSADETVYGYVVPMDEETSISGTTTGSIAGVADVMNAILSNSSTLSTMRYFGTVYSGSIEGLDQ